MGGGEQKKTLFFSVYVAIRESLIQIEKLRGVGYSGSVVERQLMSQEVTVPFFYIIARSQPLFFYFFNGCVVFHVIVISVLIEALLKIY